MFLHDSDEVPLWFLHGSPCFLWGSTMVVPWFLHGSPRFLSVSSGKKKLPITSTGGNWYLTVQCGSTLTSSWWSGGPEPWGRNPVPYDDALPSPCITIRVEVVPQSVKCSLSSVVDYWDLCPACPVSSMDSWSVPDPVSHIVYQRLQISFLSLIPDIL